MNADEFEDLAAKCLIGEASHEERERFERLLAEDAARKEQFAELKSLTKALQSSNPTLRSLGASGPPFPENRMAELQAIVHRKFRSGPRWISLWLPMAAAVVLLGVLTYNFSGRPGALDDRTAVQLALYRPLKDVMKADMLMTWRSGPSLTLYSPLHRTANLTPPIIWKAQPGKTYDLSIRDQLDDKTLPFEAKGVGAPLEFSKFSPGRELKAGGLYKLRLAEAGSQFPPTEYDLEVRADARASGPAPTSVGKLGRARAMLLDPVTPLFGDALAELLTLPGEDGDREEVLRMKLVAFGRLGLKEEHDQTLAQLKRRAK